MYNSQMMMVITEFFAKDHVDKWIKAWNNYNLKAILSLYSEDIEFRSPKIKVVYPDRTTAVINNKKDLQEYFSLGLKKFSNLHFTPIDFVVKENCIILEYYGTSDNKIKWSVIEKFEFKDGLIVKSSVFYGIEEIQ
jgi:SnoaL-like domain